MTTELKTVNELNFDEIDRKGIDQGCTFEDMVKKWLKKEAIKWVKYYKETHFEAIAYEFMKFHNITEDDLALEEDLK